LLNDHGAGSNFLTCDEGSDFDLNEIAAPELAVYCEIKQRAISHACGATIWMGSATIRMKSQVVAIW
jgi:hypothetical protein